MRQAEIQITCSLGSKHPTGLEHCSKGVSYRKNNSHGDHRDVLKPDAAKMQEDRVSSLMYELKSVSKPVVCARF